jgi:hypothetical protein
VNTQPGLRRIARKVIIESLFDYAKAHKTLTLDETATPLQKRKAVATQKGIEAFFAARHEDPWFELSEYNPEWLNDRFAELKSDPEQLERVLKLRIVTES